MIFQVIRTSHNGMNGPFYETYASVEDRARKLIPCDGAEIHIFQENSPTGSYYKIYYTINFDTLEDLIEWAKKLDNEIIITSYKNMIGEERNRIEIYDDYRE